jgi:hypothetical protein
MISKHLRLGAALGSLTLVGAVVVVACDLNPQPLPPGDTSDGAVAAAPGSGDNGGGGSLASDAGAPASLDGASGSTGPGDSAGGTPAPGDAEAATDAASDAETDATSEADVDAANGDASLDGSDGG